jgi:hypothetical protein
VIGSTLAAVCCWMLALYYMFRTVALRKPGVHIWNDTWLNPFNLLLMPSKLSTSGVIARRRFFLGVLGFLAFLGLGAVIGTITGVGS